MYLQNNRFANFRPFFSLNDIGHFASVLPLKLVRDIGDMQFLVTSTFDDFFWRLRPFLNPLISWRWIPFANAFETSRWKQSGSLYSLSSDADYFGWVWNKEYFGIFVYNSLIHVSKKINAKHAWFSKIRLYSK